MYNVIPMAVMQNLDANLSIFSENCLKICVICILVMLNALLTYLYHE